VGRLALALGLAAAFALSLILAVGFTAFGG
jgi:hypothetical protein